MIDLAAHFGENLVRCRRRAGISQEELSRRSDLHRTQIGYLERGQRICRIDTLVKLAGALEVSTDELLDGIDWTPGDYQRGGFVVREDEEA